MSNIIPFQPRALTIEPDSGPCLAFGLLVEAIRKRRNWDIGAHKAAMAKELSALGHEDDCELWKRIAYDCARTWR